MIASSCHQASAVLPRKGGRPLVSVLISAYNGGQHLQEAIDSVLAQTEGDFELLLLDDGSTDDTLNIMRRAGDPRIRVLSNEKNCGIPFSFNRLLAEATGEYIAHMGADDLSSPERLEIQSGILRDDPSLWVTSGMFKCFQDSEHMVFLPSTHDEIKGNMLFQCSLAQGFSLIRGDALRKNNINYDVKMTCAIDYDLWCRLSAYFPEARFANTDKLLGYYRIHDKQVSTEKRAEQNNMAMRGRRHLIRALGIPLTSKEIAAHEYLYHLRKVDNKLQMVQLFDWARMLKKANEETGLFDKTIFMVCLLRRLLAHVEACPEYISVTSKLMRSLSQDVNLADGKSGDAPAAE